MNFREVLTGDVQRMAHIFRFSHHPVIRKESVAEHSWFVAYAALEIGLDLRLRGHAVNIESLLTKAILHDLDESLTGDFVRDFKYSQPGLAKMIHDATVVGFRAMIDRIGSDPDTIMTQWIGCKSNDLEGTIIKLVDLSSVAAYVYGEIRTGNKHMHTIMQECTRWLSILYEGLDLELKKLFRTYFEAIADVAGDYCSFELLTVMKEQNE